MAVYNRDLYWHKDDINVICELLAVKHGDMELDLFSNSVWMHLLSFYALSNFLCVLMYDFYNKWNKYRSIEIAWS